MSQSLPNLKLLQVFIAVARCGGYARAQQELNMTTPAISAYMSELEGQLGFVLCQRGRGGFALTDKGQSFLQQSQQLLATLLDYQRQVEELKSEQGGRFSLGVVDSTVTDSQLALPEVIHRFSLHFPSVYLQLTVRDPNNLQQQLLDDRLDLAIGHFPLRMNNLITLPLYHEQHWLYCRSDHPLLQQPVSAVQIQRHGFVTRSYWNQTELIKRGFRHSTASVESIEAQLMLILSGYHIGYLPEHCAARWQQQGKLVQLLPAQFNYRAPFSLAFRRGRSRETLIRALRDFLKPGR